MRNDALRYLADNQSIFKDELKDYTVETNKENDLLTYKVFWTNPDTKFEFMTNEKAEVLVKCSNDQYIEAYDDILQSYDVLVLTKIDTIIDSYSLKNVMRKLDEMTKETDELLKEQFEKNID